jgi:hypothetical protein
MGIGSWGVLHPEKTYVLAIPRPFPCAPMVTYSKYKFQRLLLDPMVSLQLAMGDADEHKY